MIFNSFFPVFSNLTRKLSDKSSIAPHYELQETEDHYLLNFDLHGIPRENIKVEVKDNVLYVSGDTGN